MRIRNGHATIINPTHDEGGALDAEGGLLILDDVFFKDNSSLHDGGALFVAAPSTASLTFVGFSHNIAEENGGAMTSFGVTRLQNVVFKNNQTAFGNGGGFQNYAGTATLNQVDFEHNTAAEGGGAIANASNASIYLSHAMFKKNVAEGGEGGGIDNSGSLTLDHAKFTSNQADNDGGGLSNGVGNPFPSDALVTDTSFDGNVSIDSDGGGGIFNYGRLTLARVTLSGNSAVTFPFSCVGCLAVGGGLLNSGSAHLTNVTISGNSAVNGGGGIENIANLGGGSSPGLMRLLGVTVAGNKVGPGASGAGIETGGREVAGIEASYTIVAGNNPFAASQCSGPIASLGHNLERGNSCYFILPNDLVNTDPLLGPLAGNAGETKTRALKPGSPAIDAGGADCPPPATDQRGIARPQDGDANGIAACDIGAYERAP